jgi:hypothetical protein
MPALRSTALFEKYQKTRKQQTKQEPAHPEII